MALRSINGLALCAGIGGLELGLRLALGDSYRTAAYVEREAYAAACLVARMEEGHMDEAPIWDDLTTFDGKPWRGIVDIVTAGFPCQPFSLAGKRLGEADERHIWPEIARIIGECEPELVFLENVHVSAFRQPFDDLQAMGFTLSPPYAATAAEMGAGHIRRRVFVLAYRQGIQRDRKVARTNRSGTKTEVLAHSPYGMPRPRWPQKGASEPQGGILAYVDPALRDQSRRCGGPDREGQTELERLPGNPHIDPWRKAGKERQEGTQGGESAWWASEPRLERLVHGVPHRVDRDRALGNAVVPAVAAKAFLALTERITHA